MTNNSMPLKSKVTHFTSYAGKTGSNQAVFRKK